jgi:hypothetical protein
VKDSRWQIVVLGIVVSISSIPLRADNPETPYDESETTLNLLAPDNINTVVRPPIVRVSLDLAMFRVQTKAWNDSAMRYATTATLATCPSEFGLKLLSKMLLC